MAREAANSRKAVLIPLFTCARSGMNCIDLMTATVALVDKHNDSGTGTIFKPMLNTMLVATLAVPIVVITLAT